MWSLRPCVPNRRGRLFDLVVEFKHLRKDKETRRQGDKESIIGPRILLVSLS
jgi:hypothetical protein